MKIILSIVTLAIAFLSSASAEAIRGGQQERELSSYDWKYIEVWDKDYDDYKCWEAVEEDGYYYVKAKECDHHEHKQDWYYTMWGELKNREYDDYCVHYDVYNYEQYTYLALEKCTGGSNQAWNYIYYHFSSHYDGYCIDLERSSGYFKLKKCKKDDKDQEHYVEDYWFYGWD